MSVHYLELHTYTTCVHVYVCYLAVHFDTIVSVSAGLVSMH